MSFNAFPIRPQRVAIIGGGISGMAAAYLLAPHHAVSLFEAAPQLGGHARTIVAGVNGDQPVDTGFIVFNYANYPHLTRMFQALDVPVVKSDMSFGISVDDGRVEYALRNIRALVAQKRNMLRPGFARMLRDIMRFNAQAEALARDDSTTLGALMDEMQLGPWFQNYYLMPFCGAIWSTPPSEIRKFPARAILRFFRNHALLGAADQHQWWTVQGGSVEYVKRLGAHLAASGVEIHTATPVEHVARSGGKSVITAKGAVFEAFDQVIFACHADQALRLMASPTGAEQAALGAVKFQNNEMVLHRDTAQMPKRRNVWSSWVYKADTNGANTAIGVTYWMNRLQNIPDSDPLFVSLNPSRPVRDEMIYDQTTFRHPVFDMGALAAQKQLAAMQGQNNTWFAGAWLRHGFHEDGFASAARIQRQMDMAAV